MFFTKEKYFRIIKMYAKNFANYVNGTPSSKVTFGIAICVAIGHLLYYAQVASIDGICPDLHSVSW